MAAVHLLDDLDVDLTAGAGGTNFVRTFGDLVGSVDARTRVSAWVRASTDAVGIGQQFNATPSGSTITHGDQMNAANTGYTAFFDTTLGRNLMLSDLASVGDITYTSANNGQTISKKRFTGLVTISGATNLTFEGCFANTGGGSSARNFTFPTGTGITWRYCTMTPSSGSVWYPIQKFSSGSMLVEFCDIAGGENSLSETAGSMELRYNFFHRPNLSSNPGGHADLIEVFGGTAFIHHNRLRCLSSDSSNTSYFGVSPINIAPSSSGVTIEDNFIDGGNTCILVDEQGGSTITNIKVKRNKLAGHTADTFGRYTSLYNNIGDAFPIVQNDAAQTTTPRSILWPSSGVDANHWAESEDLSPNLNGQIAGP